MAADFGRDVRNLVDTIQFQQVFPGVKLAQDSKAKDKWHTQAGGVYYAVGIGGQLLGRGGDLMMIDDPFGTMADAQSEIERRNVWEWYQGTLYNRQEQNAAIVVINHRMHEDDLSGRLLAQQAAGGDRWEVVEFPAFCVEPERDLTGREEGDALWPAKYPVEALERLKRNTLPRYWSALYQQRPTPDDGTYFLREWLRPTMLKQLPARATLEVYGASDFAVTDGDGDYTVHVLIGVDPEDKLWLLDIWREQCSPDVSVEAWCDLVIKWKPLGWASEKGVIDRSIGPFLRKRAQERKAWMTVTTFPTNTGNKEIRAQSIRGRMGLMGLHVPVDAPWYADFERELLAFPAGKHDDQVDAIAWIGHLIDQMVAGRPVQGRDAAEARRLRRVRERVQPERYDSDAVRARCGARSGARPSIIRAQRSRLGLRKSAALRSSRPARFFSARMLFSIVGRKRDGGGRLAIRLARSGRATFAVSSGRRS
jgi:predicted phage terminase large subunit-like protein